METCESTDTPMVEKSKLDEDPQGKSVDPTRYCRMIGTLMYLTASRPDLMLHTRKSTSRSMQLLGDRLKEERFQVVIDLVKNSSCYKAFTISADVLEIFMQQFWYSIKKVQGMDSYEFILANKKCVVNADIFRTILDICPRVEGVNFTDVPDDDTTLAFLIKMGYKASNDKLHKSIIDILWGMFYKENVDYLELIWEDLAYQIDHRKEKRSRRENMPFPRFTKIRPKKSRGKGSQRKKTADNSQETIDVSEESEPEPESVKRKTTSKRRVKKKVTLSADDNITSDDPDTVLELGKSISQTEAEEARQVHATHARIVTEFVPERTRRRKSGKVTSDPPKKLKGVSSLTLEEQEAADIMQALKESKKTSKRQPGTGGSSKGTGTIPGVPNRCTVVSATSSVGSEQKSEYSEEDKLDDEDKDDKEGDADDEDDETESDEDDIYKYKIHVCKDEDEEMINAEVDDSNNGGENVTDAAKADDEKTLEVKDDPKKTELPPTSLIYLTVKDTTDTEINSLLEVKTQSEVPHTQSPSMLSVPVFVISKPIILTPVQESPLIATATTLPPPSVSTTPSVTQQTKTPIPTLIITTDAPIITIAGSEFDALYAVHLRVAKLEKDVSNLKKIDLFAEALATLKT
ncbi:hypothetical protein Tco_0488932 [Tanacetum coccineum]